MGMGQTSISMKQYDFLIYTKYLSPTKKFVTQVKNFPNKFKKTKQNLYSSPLFTIKTIHEALAESHTFFNNICQYLMENQKILLNLVENENPNKIYQIERLFIHIFEFYYINSYESKESKELFLMMIINLIEIELKNCEKIDDLFNKGTLVQKILFSFLEKPPILKYSIKNIRYPFLKILQELEYSDIDKLMDVKNVENILDEIFTIFQSTLQKIPFIIKFFCYASYILTQKKVKYSI